MSQTKYRFLIIQFFYIPVGAWFIDEGIQFRKTTYNTAICNGGALRKTYDIYSLVPALAEGHDRRLLRSHLPDRMRHKLGD